MALRCGVLTALALSALAGSFAPDAGADELPGLSGWSVSGTAPNEYEVDLDPAAGRDGSACAVLATRTPEITGFVTLTQTAPAARLRGRRLQLSAWIRTEAVEGWVGLWMRIDGAGEAVAFDNMQDRPLRGSAGWARHAVVLDIPPGGETLSFGIILEGPGTAWVDDFAFAFVGPEVPVTDLFRRSGEQGTGP